MSKPGTPNRTIRDDRADPEQSLAHRDAVVAAERVRTAEKEGIPRVITDYFPRRPMPAGDPASPSGTKVEMSELADDVIAAIGSAGGTGIRIRERGGALDIANVKDVVVPNGTLTDLGGGSADLAYRVDVDYAGIFEGPTIGTGDITLNKWGWWYRTTDGKMFLVRNRTNVLKLVEATT